MILLIEQTSCVFVYNTIFICSYSRTQLYFPSSSPLTSGRQDNWIIYSVYHSKEDPTGNYSPVLPHTSIPSFTYTLLFPFLSIYFYFSTDLELIFGASSSLIRRVYEERLFYSIKTSWSYICYGPAFRA